MSVRRRHRIWPWLPRLLLPCAAVAMAAATAGTGTGASAPGPAADPQQADRQQRARCLALQVTAVRAECLRQADRDLARRLADPGGAHPTPASSPAPVRR